MFNLKFKTRLIVLGLCFITYFPITAIFHFVWPEHYPYIETFIWMFLGAIAYQVIDAAIAYFRFKRQKKGEIR